MPGATTGQRIKAVEKLVHESVATVDALTPAQIHSLLPVLAQAKAELQKELQEWLSSGPGAEDKFTAYQKTQALRALEATFQRIKDLDPAMAHALGMARKETGGLAVANLNNEIARLSSIFGGGMVHLPQIDTAAVIAQGNKLLFKRHASSAKRYAGSIGDDIRVRLGVSLAKGDTFEQMVQRLRGSSAFRQAVSMSDPAAASHGVADAMFNRWRHWADRLVRTENMHAYNVQHDLSIEHVNANRGDEDEEYLRRWDASADVVTCDICKDLDRTLATIGGLFKYGYRSPPAHPYCRCVVLAWLARWGNFKGEAPSKDAHGADIAPTADKPIKQAPSQLGTPHDQAAEERRTQAAADAKAVAKQDLEAHNANDAKAKAWADKVAAAKAKQAQLAAQIKAKVQAEAAAKVTAAAQAAATKLAIEQAAAAAKIAAEQAAVKLAAEQAAAEVAAKLAAEAAAAKAAADLAAKLAADQLALDALEAQKKAAAELAKQQKLANAKAKKAGKLAATAAPFNPDTSGTIGYIPKGKAKGKEHLLAKVGMVQTDANTIVGHGYEVKWDADAGKWVTQKGPTDLGFSYSHGAQKWSPKAAPTPPAAPVLGPKPDPIKGYEWKQVGSQWVLHDMNGTPTSQLVPAYKLKSPMIGADTFSTGAQLAAHGLVPTAPGVMEGHGYKFVKDASGTWHKVMAVGQPYTSPSAPVAATQAKVSSGIKTINGVDIPAGVSDHPSGFEPMSSRSFDAQCKTANSALTSDERSGVYHYSTSSGCSMINGDPRSSSRGLRHPPPSAEAQRSIDRIDSAFKNKSARMQQDAIVFRGSGGLDYFKQFEVGGVFDDQGFVSTSMTTDNGFYSSGQVRFHISVPKGHPAIAMDSTLSAFSNEKEILLKRGSKFRVTKKEMVGGRLYLHCEVVPDAP